jgi:hypothetical protein
MVGVMGFLPKLKNRWKVTEEHDVCPCGQVSVIVVWLTIKILLLIHIYHSVISNVALHNKLILVIQVIFLFFDWIFYY